MDLRRHLLSLVAPCSVGEDLAHGATLREASTELGLRLTFDVNGEPIHVEIAPAEEGVRCATRTERLLFSYRVGSRGARVDAAVAFALCEAVAERAKVNEEQVLAAIRNDAARARERGDAQTRIREVETGRLLEPAGTREQPYFTLSPYVGCLIGCRFCYAQQRVAMVRRLGGLPVVQWGSYVDVRTDAPEVLARELEEKPSLPLKFCPIVSDPYQAVEKKYLLTRRCLEIIRDVDGTRPTMLLTRSALVTRDADVLSQIPGVYAGASIPTIDDSVRRHFEPRGASVDERLRALSTLRRAGVRTFAIVQPLLPGSVDALADALAETVSSVSIDVLHGVQGADEEFSDPRFDVARDDEWQRHRSEELSRALVDRGVLVWSGELPPGVEVRG